MVGSHGGDALGETLCVFVCPPLAQIAVFVVFAALVIKAVGHLVTYDYAYGSVVEGVVGIHVEEWALEYACGEADLVGGGIVVGIDGLGGHVPFVSVDGFVETCGNHVAYLPPFAHEYVFEVIGANLKTGVVFPLVGVAYLDVEGIELLVGHALGGVAHPVLLVDALAEGFLKIGYELKHAFFGFGGEEA